MKYMKVYTYCFMAMICLFTFCSGKNDKKPIVWKETIGIKVVDGNLNWIHYNVNGIQYKNRFDIRSYGEISGEKYTMRYNINNPKEIEIDYWNPIFEKNETTYFCVSKNIKIHWINFWEPKYIVIYYYEANGYTHKKTQSLPPNYKKNYPNLKEGQIYEIETLSENPQRAIIHLDKPIKDTTNNKS